jgi:hypothetical protein
MVLKKRTMRKISGPNLEEITGSLRKHYNEELHKLYSSQHIIRVITSQTTS